MKSIDDIFARHDRAMLMYSGGKDSLACLLLLQPYWSRVEVVWVNTGNQFPEVVSHMAAVKALVPHFTELHSDTQSYAAANGFPVDVVPTSCTSVGHMIYGRQPIKVCNRFDCCQHNLWKPAVDYYRLARPTCVIRGDRSSERVKGQERYLGIEFAFPLWEMTTEEVKAIVRKAPFGLYQPRHELPDGSSLDCMTCMAYNVEHASRMHYLKTYHPDLWASTEAFFKAYKAALAKDLKGLGE